MTNLLKNPDLQDPNWTTDDHGNQTPPHWNRTFWRPGQELPFPTKHFYDAQTKQRGTMPAICGAVPESVHKLSDQLPANERNGGEMQLIFSGRDKVYKDFGNQGAIATELVQVVDVPPLATLLFTAFILCDAPDRPGAPYGLEDDHAIVWLSADGNTEAQYDYLYLSTHFDVKDVARPWCLLSVTGKANELGRATVIAGVQKNWPGPTAFFRGPMSLTVIDPEPAPNPTPGPDYKAIALQAIKDWDKLSHDAAAIASRIRGQVGEVQG